MNEVWCFKQALFLFLTKIEDYQSFYEKQDCEMIGRYLNIFSNFSDIAKREILIDTKLQYESEL